MGWLQLSRKPQSQVREAPSDLVTQTTTESQGHSESATENSLPQPRNGVKVFPFIPESVPDEALPLITNELVLQRSRDTKSEATDQMSPTEEPSEESELWIVIDNVVFDCTDFIAEHPGGKQVILSFVGEDCSWQFWRFHGKNEMEQYGRALRVGRTQGVKNRFQEPPRYVGLSRLGDDDW